MQGITFSKTFTTQQYIGGRLRNTFWEIKTLAQHTSTIYCVHGEHHILGYLKAVYCGSSYPSLPCPIPDDRKICVFCLHAYFAIRVRHITCSWQRFPFLSMKSTLSRSEDRGNFCGPSSLFGFDSNEKGLGNREFMYIFEKSKLRFKVLYWKHGVFQGLQKKWDKLKTIATLWGVHRSLRTTKRGRTTHLAEDDSEVQSYFYFFLAKPGDLRASHGSHNSSGFESAIHPVGSPRENFPISIFMADALRVFFCTWFDIRKVGSIHAIALTTVSSTGSSSPMLLRRTKSTLRWPQSSRWL